MERLERENAELRATVAAQQVIIEKLLLRVEQLEAMVFGKGKKKKPDDHDDLPPGAHGSKTRKERTNGSYRRSIPNAGDVTDRTDHFLKACPDCQGTLIRREMVRRFKVAGFV